GRAQGDGRVQGGREVQVVEPRANTRSDRAVPVRGTQRRAEARHVDGATGRGRQAEDVSGSGAAGEGLWLRRAQREGSVELRHDFAGPGVTWPEPCSDGR